MKYAYFWYDKLIWRGSSSQACSLGQTLELGFAMEPAEGAIVRYQRKNAHWLKLIFYNLQISAKQGCLDAGSSSSGGGTWPYTISQLISSKSVDEHRQD